MINPRPVAKTASESRVIRQRVKPGPRWDPAPEWRQFVEIMVALNHSQEAIVREFRHRNLPCTSVETLQKVFPEELAHGKERRLAGYGVKLHSIAMGNTPQALSALKFLLATQGGPQWRVPKDLDDNNEDLALERAMDNQRRRIYLPERLPEPEEPDGVEIDGEAIITEASAA